jgi:hypothetical protein
MTAFLPRVEDRKFPRDDVGQAQLPLTVERYLPSDSLSLDCR